MVQSAGLEAVFLDVDDSDSLLLRLPSNQTILVDSGKKSDTLLKLKHYQSYFDRTIDLLIVTQDVPGNIYGLHNLLTRFKVKAILAPESLFRTDASSLLLEEIEKKNTELIIGNNAIDYLISKDIQIDILTPTLSAFNKDMSPLLFRMFYKNEPILLYGSSALKKDQVHILQNGFDTRASLIKIPHFGSKDSVYIPFLKNTNSKTAVISVSNNNHHGAPHKSALQSITSFIPDTHLTKHMGDIHLRYKDGVWKML